MPWSTIKTEAVVLTCQPVREADRRYCVLTPTHGKIDFLGRGAQKQQAKLASHLEPFAILKVEIIRGRRSTTVISVERQHVFNYLSDNLERRLLAQSSLSLIDRYTKEDEADEILYQMMIDWLTFLNQEIDFKPVRSTLLLGGFMLRLLTRLGYKIELSRCLDCGEEIMPLSFRWHGARGGLICTDCFNKNKQEWFAARQVSEEVIKLLRFARDRKYSDLMRPELISSQVEEFAKIVHDLICFHLPGSTDTPFWAGVLAPFEFEQRVESV